MKHLKMPFSKAACLMGIVLATACGKDGEDLSQGDSIEIKGDPIVPIAETNSAEDSVEMETETKQELASEQVGDAFERMDFAEIEVMKPSAELLEDGILDVSFDRLASFEYGVPEDLTRKIEGEEEGVSSQIPESIRALNNKSIALKGFMLPLKVEEGLVTEMLIMRDQSMCCYGTTPKINEWVSVKMKGNGVKAVMDQVVRIFGTLKVGEIRENDYLVGIYEMDGNDMDVLNE